MSQPPSNETDGPKSKSSAALREVRYSLREMVAEVREERKQSALGRELVDATEIKKMFGNRKQRKTKKKAGE